MPATPTHVKAADSDHRKRQNQKKQKQSVFDLQRKNVRDGTLKEALAFERGIDEAGKKDMPV